VSAPRDPEALAEALLSAHPDAEPYEVTADDLVRWVAGLGGDPSDDRLMAAAVVAWEARRG
jgi:Fe-S-cluster formation regulator IscX/YfhJ